MAGGGCRERGSAMEVCARTELREGNRPPMSVLADDVAAHDWSVRRCGNLP